MTLPSFAAASRNSERIRPPIYVLEVRDRDKPDSDPIAWFFIERRETYRRDDPDNTIYEASITLHYEQILPKYANNGNNTGHFSAGYRRGYSDNPITSLTYPSPPSKGAVFLDFAPKGQRIGTYLMNQIVVWAKQWPEATICPISLQASQATIDNKARRNRFYEQFGLTFDYTDTEQKEGQSRPIPANALTPVANWQKNIHERNVPDYIGELLHNRDRTLIKLADRDCAVGNLKQRIRQAETKPIQWALRQTWQRLLPNLILIGALSLLGGLIWFAIKNI